MVLSEGKNVCSSVLAMPMLRLDRLMALKKRIVPLVDFSTSAGAGEVAAEGVVQFVPILNDQYSPLLFFLFIVEQYAPVVVLVDTMAVGVGKGGGDKSYFWSLQKVCSLFLFSLTNYSPLLFYSFELANSRWWHI